MNTKQIKNLVMAGVCLALCLFLPFLTGQIPHIGKALSPMHIPVLLCGFICGWQYGLVVGFIAPILRYFIFGMPAMPSCLIMAFELAAYGTLTGIFYRLLPKKMPYVYITLILAMLLGRVVWGIASVIIMGINGNTFGIEAFIAGGFTNAVPGIVCHIVLVPVLVIALQKAGMMNGE